MRCSTANSTTAVVVLAALGGGCSSSTVPPVAETPRTSASTPPALVNTVPQQDLHASSVALRREWAPRAEPRDWKYVVLHHTATDRGSVESIHETHLRRTDAAGNRWLGIGYHFVVGNGNGMPDGRVEPTFRWRQQLHGAHAGSRDHNFHGIGVCLVGNFENGPPTSRQLHAVKALVASLSREYGIDRDHVVAHRELKPTACPGKFFSLDDVALLAEGRRERSRSAERHSAARHSPFARERVVVRTAHEEEGLLP